MGLGTYLALAFGPALILVHAVWSRDRRREPIRSLSVYFAVGAFSVFPAALVEFAFRAVTPERGPVPAMLLLAAISAFLVIGPAEEGCKFIALWQRGVRDPHLDEPFDWLVYSVAVSLGFATAENSGYVAIGGVTVGWIRAFSAVPAHALDGTLMGWRLARASGRKGPAAARERWLAWIEPSLWHAAYDFPLLALQHVRDEDVRIALGISWFGVLGMQWVVCTRRLRRMCAEQRVPPPPPLLPDRLARRWRGRAP